GNTSPVLNCVLAGTNCGSWFSTDSTASVLDSLNTWLSTVTTGLEDSRSRRVMREPVTCTSSSVSVSSAPCSASAAKTGFAAPAPTASATAIATRQAGFDRAADNLSAVAN